MSPRRCVTLSQSRQGRPITVAFRWKSPRSKRLLHKVPPRTLHRVWVTVSNLSANTVDLIVYIGGRQLKDGFRFAIPPGTVSLFDHPILLGSGGELRANVNSDQLHFIGEAELC